MFTRRSKLERQSGIHDVLGCRAVVQPAVWSVRESLRDLTYQRQDGVPHVAAIPPELFMVDVASHACGGNRLGVRMVDEPKLGLGTGELGLGTQPRVDNGGFRPDLHHWPVAVEGGQQVERCGVDGHAQSISSPPSTLNACPVT